MKLVIIGGIISLIGIFIMDGNSGLIGLGGILLFIVGLRLTYEGHNKIRKGGGRKNEKGIS